MTKAKQVDAARKDADELRNQLARVNAENRESRAENELAQNQILVLQEKLENSKSTKGRSSKLRRRVQEMEERLESRELVTKQLEKELKQVTRKKSNLSKNLRDAEAEVKLGHSRSAELLKLTSKIMKMLLLGRENSLKSIAKRMQVKTNRESPGRVPGIRIRAGDRVGNELDCGGFAEFA